MSTWIPSALIGLAIAAITNALNFYRGWVPDVDVQKRHVKRAAFWTWNIANIAAQAYGLYRIAHSSLPVTPEFVVLAASLVGGIAITLVFLILDKLDSQLSQTIEIQGRIIDLMKRQYEVLSGKTAEHAEEK